MPGMNYLELLQGAVSGGSGGGSGGSIGSGVLQVLSPPSSNGGSGGGSGGITGFLGNVTSGVSNLGQTILNPLGKIGDAFKKYKWILILGGVGIGGIIALYIARPYIEALLKFKK